MTNRTTAMLAGCVMFCFTIAGAVAIAVAVPDGANPGSLIALLFAALASSLAIVVGVAKLDGRLDGVAGDVRDLKNGTMDAKIRAAVADVIHSDLQDQGVQEQLQRDRQLRAKIEREHK